MVVLTELSSVFWGVALEGGQKYSQTTTRPVHISMAALDPTKKSDDGPLSVMIEHSSGSYVLCTLQRGVLFQQPLNLDFAAGEELSFYINGNGSIHLSGYFMPEDNYPSDSDLEDNYDSEEVGSDEEESDEDEVTTKGKRRRDSGSANKSKRARLVLDDDEDDDDDSDDEDFIVDEAEEASEDEDDDEDEEDEFDDDELEEESDDEETPKKGKKESSSKAVVVVKPGKETAKANSANVPSESKKKKTNAENKNTPSQPAQKNGSQSQQAGNASVETEGKKKKKKKNKKKKNKNNEQNQQQQQPSTSTESTTRATPPSKPTKRVAEGGVVIEELKEGHGPETKMGKMVRVYYTGRLANGKVFDACTSGNGFKFKLGKKEVISGWDVGLKGMKVGGKRKLVIPPQMGYGTQRAGPIPPNSTLVFDVELKAVG